MRSKFLFCLAIFLIAFGLVGSANAALIDFTGGTAYLLAGGTGNTTPGSELYWDVDYYVEDGFIFDYAGTGGYIGDYYGGSELNDVIHGHFPGMGYAEITKEGGGTFDLNYFVLTSNTLEGPSGTATGTEEVFIEAWVGGVMTYSQLLPSEAWGRVADWPADLYQNDPAIYLGSEFDAVDAVRFTATSGLAFCFGMDEFYIDEPPPPPVPEPSTMFLLGAGVVGLIGTRRKLKK